MKQMEFKDLGELLTNGLPVNERVEFTARVSAYETKEARSAFFSYIGNVSLINRGSWSGNDWKEKDRYELKCCDVEFKFHMRGKVKALGERSESDCKGIRYYEAEIAIPIDITENALLVLENISDIRY